MTGQERATPGNAAPKQKLLQEQLLARANTDQTPSPTKQEGLFAVILNIQEKTQHREAPSASPRQRKMAEHMPT